MNTGGGTPRLSLTIGSSTVFANYESGSGSSALLFRYTVQAGDEDTNGIALSATLDPNVGTLRDAAGNNINTTLNSIGSLTAVLVDGLLPTLAEVTAVTTPANDSTPNVTFSTTEAGTLAVGGSCGSASEGAISTGNITIALTQTDNSTALAAGTYNDCTVTVTDAAGNASSVLSLSSFDIDIAAPSVAEVTPVTTPTNDSTPDVIISSDEAGTLAIGGSCGSASEGAISAGNSTIALTQTDNSTALAAGTYSDCTATVTDAAGNSNSPVTLTTFTLDLTNPTVAEVTAVSTPGNDNTPNVTFSSDKAGTLAVGGSCGSASEGAIGTGNTTIALTQTDNSSALADGTYSDCTVTVTDSSANASNVLALTSFVVDASAPNVDTNTGISIAEGDTGSSLGSAQLSASDNLSNAANVTYSLVSAPSNGTLRRSGSALSNASTFTQDDINNNLITYDHDGSDTASDTFAFTLSDALGNLNDNGGGNFSFAITVGAVNDAPLTTADTASTNEDNSVEVDVLGNDSDVDGTLIAASVTIVSAPANGGTAINTSTGAITYTPNANSDSADNFTYTVEDNNGLASAATSVTITVNAQNDAPIAIADAVSTSTDTLVSIDVAANDTDVDTGDFPDPTTIVVVGAASNGSAVFNGGTNQIDYTPNSGFTGSDTFTYTIDDNSSGSTSNVATVTVTVTDPNTAPTATNDTANAFSGFVVAVDVASNDTDVDAGDSPDPTTIAL